MLRKQIPQYFGLVLVTEPGTRTDGATWRRDAVMLNGFDLADTVTKQLNIVGMEFFHRVN